jgi:hypothetical protein
MKRPLFNIMLLAVAAMVSAVRGLRLAANTYDAAVETHDASVRRTNDAAVTARHLLWQQGSTDGGVALGAASACPLGTIDNVESSTGLGQMVLLLGKGATKKMVASEAITAGEQVFTAASGKVQDTPTGATVYLVGTALTAAGADGDIIEVADCAPVRLVFA